MGHWASPGAGRGLCLRRAPSFSSKTTRPQPVFEVADGAAMLYELLPDGRRQVVEMLGRRGRALLLADTGPPRSLGWHSLRRDDVFVN
jgi:hypothetical protein